MKQLLPPSFLARRQRNQEVLRRHTVTCVGLKRKWECFLPRLEKQDTSDDTKVMNGSEASIDPVILSCARLPAMMGARRGLVSISEKRHSAASLGVFALENRPW